jgi:hypothetical protein
MKSLRDMTEPELRTLLNAVGKSIESAALSCEVERPLFAAILFNDPEVGQYVCNCERGTVIKALRETADRLEARDIVSRVEFPEGLGATGDFPAGKMHERDEGGLNLGIGSDRKTGKVLVSFGKPVARIGMSAAEALQMADSLRWHATKMKG